MNSFFAELVSTGIYKRSQGRIARQASFAAIALCALVGSYRFQQFLIGDWGTLTIGPEVAWPVFAVLTAAFAWIAFRLVNWPRFADFLIAVEAEMAKVSWPSRKELIRSSIVVLVNMVVLAALLWLFDAAWFAFFRHIVPLL